MKALRYLCLLLLLAVAAPGTAAVEQFLNTKKGTGISGSAMSITDPYHNQLLAGGGSAPALFRLNSTEVSVKFYFDDALRKYYSSAWTATLIYKIEAYNASGTLIPTVPETLAINYDPALPYTDMVMKKYAGASRAKIQVVSITGLSPVPNDVYLDLVCTVNRDYKLQAASPRVKTEYTALDNTLKFDWTYARGAEWYELEYLFVDYGNEALGTAKDFDFKNATRITTSAQTYTINMMYPRGKMLYRVRAVAWSTQYANEKVYTNWSYIPLPGQQTDYVETHEQLILGTPYEQFFDYEGFEPHMNWAASSGFAEEGKRSDKVGFMDGLMRGRQQVMMNQQDKRPIASEIVYDFVGRPAVQFLPSPVRMSGDSGMNYYHDLNQALTGTGSIPYDYRYFDTDDKIITPGAVDGASSRGAAFYYSDQNTSDPGFNSAYIPDAEGYPFVRTHYRNDGTDRVKSQSGVGDEFVDGMNNSVRILYGSPGAQMELDRLFGNEAGDVHMYSKEVVTDANGQKMVKYIDNEGRVIATALAGVAPTNLHEIDSRPDDDPAMKANLHTYNQLSDHEWSVNHSFTVAVEADYTFDYDLNGDTLCNDCIEQENPVATFPHCTECKYDLEIKLVNNTTNEEIFHITQSNVHDYSFSSPITALLSEGSYTIYKTLKLHEDFVSSNLQYFLENQDCIELVVPDGGDCAPTCTTMCEQSISYVDPATNNIVYFEMNEDNEAVIVGVYLADEEEWDDENYPLFDQTDADALLTACLASCEAVEPPSAVYPCDLEYQTLLNDMTPGGQYFDNLPDLWDNATDGGVYDENGWLEARYPGTAPYVPSALWSLLNLASPAPETNTTCTWDDLRDAWVPAWGHVMVQVHPEYCAFSKRCDGCKSLARVDADEYKEFYTHITTANPNFYTGSSCAPCTTCTVNASEKFFNPTAITQDNTSAGVGNDNQSYQPFDVPVYDVDKEYDPLLECLKDGSNTENDDLAALLSEMLQKFLPTNAACTTYYSIWYVMRDPDGIAYNHCNTSANADVENYFDIVHGNSSVLDKPGIIGTGPGQISEAEFFRRAYMLFREKVLYDYVGRCTDLQLETVEDGKNAEGFYVRYPQNPVYASWPDPYSPCDLDDMATGVIGEAEEDLCTPYVDEWMTAITAQCTTYTSPQLDAIEAGLLEICMNSDPGEFPYEYNVHASGTVTVNSVSCSTFVQVAQAYGCTMSSTPEIPQEYDQAECACEQIHAFLTENGFTFASDEDDVLEALITADLLTTAEEGSVTSGDVLAWLNECEETGGPDYPDFTDLINAFQCPANLDNTQDADQWVTDCNAALDSLALFNATNAFNEELNALGEEYKAQIYSSCLDTGETALKERFTMSYELAEYHYTLYYYDQAGNLVKTVSPEGNFHKGSSGEWTSLLSGTDLEDVADHRATGTGTYVHPDHQLITNYKYNSLNQLTERATADEGKSTYFYDYLGRLVASQNAKQAASNKYSIVIYDELSREVMAFIGYETSPLTQATAGNPTAFASWLGGITGSERTEITEIVYDEPMTGVAAIITPTVQENLRNRIATVAYTQTGGSPIGSLYDYATHYTYDIHGNVKEVVQDNQQLAKFDQHIKRIAYEYELVSGNVNQVKYQEGQYDQFYHKYHYDKNNMVEEVYTSKDGYIWERDADYFYQPAGQLARSEQGQRAVNGQDYTYTLQGWLKGVNSNTLNSGRDPGKDGNFIASTGANKYYGKDVMGYTMGYYQGDYKSVTGTSSFEATTSGFGLFTKTKSNLYNGNIGHVVMSQYTAIASTPTQRTMGKAYEYDQLNRLMEVETNQQNTSSSSWGSSYTPDNKFKETGVSYDGNGNILTWKRYGSTGSLNMDDLTYQYNISSDHLTNNRLNYLDDNVGYTCNYTTDIDDQSSGNYQYNEIGQMKSDAKEFIDEILWYERGKVRMVVKNKAVNTVCSTEVAKNDVEYLYDGLGHKIGKVEKPHVGSGGDLNKPDKQQKYKYTWYVNDALGNVISIYEQGYGLSVGGTPSSFITQEDVLIMGGMYNPEGRTVEYTSVCSTGVNTVTTATLSGGGNYQEQLINLSGCTMTVSSGSLSFNSINYTAERTSNQKQFELNNHLGSVVTVTSDRKLSYDGNSDNIVDNYYPEINSWYDTYAFGSVLDAGGSNDYRYGFNGMEKGKELYSGAYEADFRMVDCRIGRWFSTDPIEKPWESPYAGFANNPIWYTDPSGLDAVNEQDQSQSGGNEGEKPKIPATEGDPDGEIFNEDNRIETGYYDGGELDEVVVNGSSDGGAPGTESGSQSENDKSNDKSKGNSTGQRKSSYMKGGFNDNPYKIDQRTSYSDHFNGRFSKGKGMPEIRPKVNTTIPPNPNSSAGSPQLNPIEPNPAGMGFLGAVAPAIPYIIEGVVVVATIIEAWIAEVEIVEAIIIITRVMNIEQLIEELEDAFERYRSFPFSKKKGNQKNDAFEGWNDEDINKELEGLKGRQLDKNGKAYKRALETEQKVRKLRNIQKRNNKK